MTCQTVFNDIYVKVSLWISILLLLKSESLKGMAGAVFIGLELDI